VSDTRVQGSRRFAVGPLRRRGTPSDDDPRTDGHVVVDQLTSAGWRGWRPHMPAAGTRAVPVQATIDR